MEVLQSVCWGGWVRLIIEVTICPTAGQLFEKTKCPAVFLCMSFSGSGYISSLSSINLVFNSYLSIGRISSVV